MDRYSPRHTRFELDARHLLDEPLQKIVPFLQHRTNDLKLVQETADRLRNRLAAAGASGGYDWGVCHGDLHGWNVFHSEDEGLTHFDFDCCGMGWRSYDVSVFLWARVDGKTGNDSFKDDCWDSFLKAYMKERPLSDQDISHDSGICCCQAAMADWTPHRTKRCLGSMAGRWLFRRKAEISIGLGRGSRVIAL